MKTRLHHVLLILSLFAGIHKTAAQGTAFTYQGFLTQSGAPVNGTNDFEFRLFNAVSAGTQRGGTVPLDDVVVTNGLFTVTLDFGATPFDGSVRWLDIAVRPGASVGSYTNLVPRQPITSTPYAVRAANAASAATVAAGGITGTMTLAQLPSVMVTNGASGVNISGTFSGNGAGVTNVSLATLNSGGFLTWGSFFLSSSPSVGNNPQSVTAADVNGDGKVDLISANVDDNTLTVLTNNGSGGFGLASSPGVGDYPTSVAAADVNGDGKLDLISANYYANSLTVLTNNGSTGFGLAATLAVGSDPHSVVAADVNGDGKVDLISANTPDNTLTVLTNNGSGGFVTASTPFVGSQPVLVVAADVNGDGKVDLISANSDANTLTVLTNNGSGGFVISSSPGVGSYPSSVVAADMNGDGKMDLICANFGFPTLTVLTNTGSGGFVTASTTLVGRYPSSVVAADMNEDGKVDLISAISIDNTLMVLTNNGSVGFELAASLGVGNYPQSVVAADVNGDGKVDLISANASDNTLTVLLNAPIYTGNFSGNGSGLTGLNASQLTSGTIGVPQLPAIVALRSGGNGFSGNQIFTNGNVGIGTNNPSATLDVNGSLRVGNGTTIFSGLQGGVYQMTFTSGTAKTNFTFTFSKAFTTAPKVILTARNEPGQANAADTYAVSVRSVTTTTCAVNITRVDTAAGWGQLVMINWLAWE